MLVICLENEPKNVKIATFYLKKGGSVWESGQVVSGVALHRPSLDQAFPKYTGRSLRDAEQAVTFDKRAAAIAARRRA
jgi:hypothetical protein